MRRRKKPGWSSVCVLCAALLLGGCAGVRFGGSGEVSHESFIKSFSDKAVLLDLSFEKQKTRNLCGLAAVGMLTSFYNLPLTREQRETLVAEASGGGISGEVLKKVLEEAGYYVAVFPGALDKGASGVFHQIDLGRPLLVMTTPETGAEHYTVISGYDPEKGLLAMVDPSRGRIAVRLERFKAEWERSNRFTLVAVPQAEDGENIRQ